MTDQIDQIDTHDEEKTPSTADKRRRMFLTGAGIAGAAAIVGSKPASAADGNAVILGTDNVATQLTTITNDAVVTDRSRNALRADLGAGNNSHTILGTTQGAGHAIAGVVGAPGVKPDDAVAATWGRTYGDAAATEGQSLTEDVALAGPANGVKGIVQSATNGSHAVLGITNGAGHSVAGDTPADAPNTVAATWGRHAGQGAGVGGVNTAAASPLAGPARGVEGVVTSAANGSHAVFGATNGAGHSVAGDTPADAAGVDGEGGNSVAATWGRHAGQGAGVGGVNTATASPLAGPARGVEGVVTNEANGSHAVFGLTNGAGHSVAGDTPADAKGVDGVGPNTTAATWGRHGGVGAGIGGVSALGYGGEFIGGKSHIRLIQNSDAPAGPPTGDDHLLGEIYADGAGSVWYNQADGANWTNLTGGSGIVLFDDGVRAFDSRTGRTDSIDTDASRLGRFSANETREIDLTEIVTDLPASATGAIINLTVVNPDGGQRGFATVFNGDTDDADRPNTSSINWGSDTEVVANSVTAKVSSTGSINVFARQATDILVDVLGYVG